jgi:hypothetical protein
VASFAFSKSERLFAQNAGWRTFELTMRVDVLKPSGTTHVWLPAALVSGTPYQKTLANTFQCDGGTAKTFESKTEALGIIAEFPPGVRPILTAYGWVPVDRADVRKVSSKNRPPDAVW